MTHAVVLIKAERAALPTLGERLAEVDGASEAYSAFQVYSRHDLEAMFSIGA